MLKTFLLLNNCKAFSYLPLFSYKVLPQPMDLSVGENTARSSVTLVVEVLK